LKNCTGSSDENDDKDESEDEDEDEDNPPAVIDKSKKTSFTRELVHFDGNLASEREAPGVSHRRRSQTNHRGQRNGRPEIASSEAD